MFARMTSTQPDQYPQGGYTYPMQHQLSGEPERANGGDVVSLLHSDRAHSASQYAYDERVANNFEATHPDDSVVRQSKGFFNMSRRRLYILVPISIIAIVLTVLFQVYKTDFDNWVQPLTNWLQARAAWSWAIPVAILFVLSFPPLFGHEIVALIVGLTYPLGVAIGIVCAGAVLGECGCFIVFKYGFTRWVDKKIATNVKWAAVAKVAQEAGFKGVLLFRYSIIPPHLLNPLFSCTGMKFWLYMSTVILSLPKNMVLVALGTPSSEHSAGGKAAKVIAVSVLVLITLFASRWTRTKLDAAVKEIEAERAISQTVGDEIPLQYH